MYSSWDNTLKNSEITNCVCDKWHSLNSLFFLLATSIKVNGWFKISVHICQLKTAQWKYHKSIYLSISKVKIAYLSSAILLPNFPQDSSWQSHCGHTGNIGKDLDNTLIYEKTLDHCWNKCLPIKWGTCAFIDHLPVPFHLKVWLTIVTAVIFKLINSLKINIKKKLKQLFTEPWLKPANCI